MSRQQAKSHYKKALKKLTDGRMLNDQQELCFNWLAGTFVWEAAFNDDELMEDFTKILIDTGALNQLDQASFFECKTFVTLHALTAMHMSRLLLPDGSFGPLRLMIREETGTLRIKANILVTDVPKPVTCSLSVFETKLDANTHSIVRPEIADYESEVPVEIGKSGKIEALV
jgi:hypothetical protein